MNHNWQVEKYECSHCKKVVEFRWAYKRLQFKSGMMFTEIVPSAQIVLCIHCGNSFWIPTELRIKAEL